MLSNIVTIDATLNTSETSHSQAKRKTKIFLYQLHRHGDRTPFETYPGDKYDISYWPEGWGQLTNVM